MSRRQAAEALCISIWVLDRLIADRKLPTIKFPSTKHPGEDSRRVLISVDALRAFIEKHQEKV
jgi:hypothetical protein